MNEPLEAFCDRWLAAWRGGDPEPLLAFYHPQAFYLDPAHPAGLHGAPAIGAYLARLLPRYPDWVWTRDWLHPLPDGFVLRWRARIRPDSPSEATGMDLVRLSGDRIVRNEVYFDPRRLFGQGAAPGR